MCMFSRPIQRVSKTQLTYVRFGYAGRHYALQTYANDVQTANPTAMILPVRAKKEEVKVLNTEGDQSARKLFDRLHDLFEAEKPSLPQAQSFGVDWLAVSNSAVAYLPVVRAGSYEVSTAANLAELTQLDPEVFQFDSQLIELLRRPQGEEWCYIACKLVKTDVYQPFSYVYPVDGARIGSIPTQHYHPRDASTFFFGRPASSSIDYADDWDHEIMVVGVPAITGKYGAVRLSHACTDDSYVKHHLGTLLAGFTGGQHTIEDGCAYRLEIRGSYPNRDIDFAMPFARVDHLGVTCNACSTRRGQPTRLSGAVRYKCMRCADVDVCGECMNAKHQTGDLAHDSGIEPGHIWMALKTDADAQWMAQQEEVRMRGAKLVAHIKAVIQEEEEKTKPGFLQSSVSMSQ